MNIVYQLQGVEFEWDSNKAQSNLDKHGITFEEATEVFFDPFYQVGDATPKMLSNSKKREFIASRGFGGAIKPLPQNKCSFRTRCFRERIHGLPQAN